MTGSSIPEIEGSLGIQFNVSNDADAVARAENGETIGKYVYVYSPVSHGKNVSYTGEDIKKGSTATIYIMGDIKWD